MFTDKATNNNQTIGIAGYALAKAVLDKLVTLEMISAAEAKEVISSAARNIRNRSSGDLFNIAADHLEAVANGYDAPTG